MKPESVFVVIILTATLLLAMMAAAALADFLDPVRVALESNP